MEFLTHFEPIGDQTFWGAMSVKSVESVESVKSVVVKKGYGYKIRARKRKWSCTAFTESEFVYGWELKKSFSAVARESIPGI